MTQEQHTPEESKDVAALREALNRDVYCLFGLPVDNHTLTSAKKILRERIKQGRKTVLSTVNLNWVAQSLRDSNFRQAILNSDLVVIDGHPLLWLAKLIGCPMKETVPGSTLIDELLNESEQPPLSIFLFGGDGDTAALAMQRINERENAGLKAVGALNPGFGSVEEMSSAEILDTINAAQPDILLVALGAQKGTQWIEYNRDRLNAKVISHLGATINFLAGTVVRAPRWVQKCGFEWGWRIAQEPKLFGRYLLDGLKLSGFLIPRIPVWLKYLKLARQSQVQASSHTIQPRISESDTITLLLPSRLCHEHVLELQNIIKNSFSKNDHFILDFEKTFFADISFWGILILLDEKVDQKSKITIDKSRLTMCSEARLFCPPRRKPFCNK
nr:WecB/TagA/CpsF family glycosyltransferase [uncultured Desulfobulbus sp.]